MREGGREGNRDGDRYRYREAEEEYCTVSKHVQYCKVVVIKGKLATISAGQAHEEFLL